MTARGCDRQSAVFCLDRDVFQRDAGKIERVGDRVLVLPDIQRWCPGLILLPVASSAHPGHEARELGLEGCHVTEWIPTSKCRHCVCPPLPTTRCTCTDAS